MTTRNVVIRTRRGEEPADRGFAFDHHMVAAITDSWNAPSFVKTYREQAWNNFQRIPLPTIKDEAWRRTSLQLLPLTKFVLPGKNGQSSEKSAHPPKYLLRSITGQDHGGQIIMTPTATQIKLASELVEKGVVFTDLETAVKSYPRVLESIQGQVVHSGEGKFAALTGALANYGVLLYVPRGLKIELPLHSIFWGSGSNLALFSHLLVWVDDDASVTYVHENSSQTEPDDSSMHGGIVEILIGNGGSLNFVELQSWGEHVWNFSHERARLNANAKMDWVFGAIGSHLTKNFSDIDLVGPGATSRMSGFYFTDGVQHLDHDTQQNHLAPDTTSDLLFKGAVNDRSRSIWQGMIYVAREAQKADGYQANRNLVLSPEAHADSIPGLEILADDVRCTHGATVGKIDPDQIFYLQSRGIPQFEASRLIVEGFFDPIMQRIPFEGVRSRFQESIVQKMKKT